jgi:hypothetical protein
MMLMALGAGVGSLLGLLSALQWLNWQPLPKYLVAQVNDTDIERAEFERALNMLASEKRDAITDADKELVLRRLIEEELLVQYGLSSGLLNKNRELRAQIVKSQMDGVALGGRDEALRDYIEQLRSEASIEWVNR